MRSLFSGLGLTLVLLGLLDLLVAAGLHWAEETNRLGSLVRYFEYGRSVPGKLARWESDSGAPGNIYDLAWRPEIVAASEQAFSEEDPAREPVVRTYGMSFVNNIMRASLAIRPEIVWDQHSGPSAPPNFTFALFQDDHAARRAGDIVVLGLLSSALPGMAALSNRTWVFEQPAPFTYPVYRPEGDGLRRVDPLVTSARAQREMSADARQAWAAQLYRDDLFFGPHSFGLTWLDGSPFARLVRRSLATSQIQQTKAAVLAGGYPYKTVLERMVREFARSARADGQIPLVLLVQSQDPADPDLLALLRPVLEQDGIRHFATAEHFDPRDGSGFLSDGHYAPHVDRLFAERFVALLDGI